MLLGFIIFHQAILLIRYKTKNARFLKAMFENDVEV